MAQFTPKYKLGYFQKGDKTSADVESSRWRTVDAQMYALFDVLGNGVISGWEFNFADLNSATLSISPGSGHVGHVAVETTVISDVALSYSTRNYIYAVSNLASYFSKSVSFVASPTEVSLDSYLYLGYVDTDTESRAPVILDYNIDDRQYISFRQQIINLVKNHKHIGGTNNPSKINLATDVQGYLSPDNMSDLDASMVLTGVLDYARIPQLDHITRLTNTGVLTHAQLDTFVQIMSNSGQRLMGEISSVDLLKMVLAVKHVYPDIDEFLVNELAFIPGISPDSVVDQKNTTAEVDYRPSSEGGTHTIKGSSAESVSVFTKSWDTIDELQEGTLNDLVLVGNSLMLATKESRVFVSDFDDVSDWETVITDMSSISSSFVVDKVMTDGTTSSGKLTVNSQSAEVAFVLRKTFAAQDWSDYNKVSFQFYCNDATHGDIYFFIFDAISGSQNSYTLILERNSPTINQETQEIGWRETVIDISRYTRSNITGIGFYTSTTSGWIVNDQLGFNVDSMYLTSGNTFVERGTAVYKYGNDYQYTFTNIRWTASVPDDTYVLVRTRVSDREDMSDAAWSSYITESGGSIVLPSPSVYKYIEIEVTLESDPAGLYGPQFYALYLDSNVVSDNKTFEFNDKESWKSGTLYNIDADSSPGSIKIKSISDLGNYIYSADGKISQLNTDFTEKLSIYGDNIPRSFNQMLNGSLSGFGQVSSISIGIRDSFLIADTDNDRVLEIDKTGRVLWGLMGTFFSMPVNPYATVPTSSDSSSSQSPSSGSSSSTETINPFKVVGCYYNYDDSVLSIMFNKYLENVYTSSTFTASKIYLKAGTRRIYLDSTKNKFSLVGVTEEFYGQTFENNMYLSGSNTLQVEMTTADSATIASAAINQDPYLVAVSPKTNQIISDTSLDIEFNAYNCTISEEENGIRVQVDGGAYTDLRTSTSLVLTGLADGIHTIYAFLIDENGNRLANAESSVLVKFYVSTGLFTETAVSVLSLSQNQIVSTGTFSINFLTYNVPPAHELRYTIDGGQYYSHDSPDPIQISDLSLGEHSIRFYISDLDNEVLAGDLTDVTIDMVVSTRIASSFHLVVERGAIQTSDAESILDYIVPVEATPIRLANIYSPVDVQLIIEDSVLGDMSEFNVLITKVGTPSYLNYYNSAYKDGYSVVEYSSAGVLQSSDNTAVVGVSKEYAKTYLGGAKKYGGSELFIADPYGKRAIVVVMDTSKKTSSIIWQYDSDRIISDFNRVPKDESVINVNENAIDRSELYVRRDSVVTWYNNTNDTIRILSGNTTYEQFYLDPDFDFFGSDFDSGDILPGQYYSFRFINVGTYDYFVYPFIYTGQVSATETSIVPDDNFVLAENDPDNGSFLNRVIKIDSWGNVIWEFGQSYVAFVKDAIPVSENEVVITV